MGGKGLSLRLSAGALAIAAMAPALPAAAARQAPQTPSVHVDAGIKIEMLRQLKDLGAPQEITDLITQQEASVEEGRSTFAFPSMDLDLDGIPEVIEETVVYRIAVSDSQTDLNQIVVEEVRTLVRIRRGTDGKVVWKKRFDDFVVAVPTYTGRAGRPGVLVVGGLLSWFGDSAGERFFTLESLRGTDGRRQWARDYRAVGASRGFTTTAASNSPVSISLFQGLPGDAVDVLIGLGDYVQTPLLTTVATRTVVVDGSDGTEVLHPTIDVGVDWVPHPSATSDADADGLHDYIVINNPGIDAGGPQEPPSFGGVIYSRRGTDGSEIWTTGGLTFMYYAAKASLPDVIGNGARDFAIATYHPREESPFPLFPSLPISFSNVRPVVMLVDGATGYVRWTKTGEWAMSPGDLTHDGKDDVVVEQVRATKKRVRYEQRAFTMAGKKLWTHDVTWEPPPCLGDACFRGWFGWAWGMGDVQPDAVRETFVGLVKWDSPGGQQQKNFVMDGESGRVLLESDETLSAAGVPIDAHGSDVLTLVADESTLSVRARTGQSGDTLWRTVFKGPDKLLKGKTFAWGTGFYLPGDPCGDIIVEVNRKDSAFYAVLSGADGKMLWSFWSGARSDRPKVTETFDGNAAC